MREWTKASLYIDRDTILTSSQGPGISWIEPVDKNKPTIEKGDKLKVCVGGGYGVLASSAREYGHRVRVER
jgi:hypothetical protein